MERFHSETTTLTAMTILLTQSPTVVFVLEANRKEQNAREAQKHTGAHLDLDIL